MHPAALPDDSKLTFVNVNLQNSVNQQVKVKGSTAARKLLNLHLPYNCPVRATS